MNLFELTVIIFFGFILGISVLLGLKLDDNAQQMKEATWERFEEIDNAIK